MCKKEPPAPTGKLIFPMVLQHYNRRELARNRAACPPQTGAEIHAALRMTPLNKACVFH